MRAFESPQGHFELGGDMVTTDRGLIEIRFHGRGGQGAVTAAEVLATAIIAQGRYAQAFPSFGPERRGAPVQAFVRLSEVGPIRIRAGITTPDVVVVLEERLMVSGGVTSGLKDGGLVVINSRRPAEEVARRLTPPIRLAVVDATAIARELLGVPIVNTTMLGALSRASGLVQPEELVEPLRMRLGRLAEKNIAAMQKAYQETVIKEVTA